MKRQLSAEKRVTVARADLPAEQIESLSTGEGWQWIYFGRNLQRFYSIREILGDGGRLVSAGAPINEVAAQIREDFINLDRVLAVDISNPLWQTTDLAEKNPYTSDLFYNCCALLAFDRLLDGPVNHLIVFVEARHLGLALLERARDHGLETRRLLFGGVWDHLPARLAALRLTLEHLLYSLGVRVRFLRMWQESRRAIARHVHPRRSAIPDEWLGVETLLVTWATPDMFDPARNLEEDTYFGDLPRFLRKAGKNIGYLANPTWFYPPADIAQNVAAARDAAFLPDEAISLGDALRIALATLFAHWPLKAPLILGGLDMTGLLRREMWIERSKLRQPVALKYYSIGRWLREKAPKVETLLHPLENQPWEKALRLGIRRHCPNVRVAGCQHASFAPSYLSFFPSAHDLAHGQIPDRIMVIGDHWRDVLVSHGCPAEQLTTGPALRFAYLFSDRRAEHPPVPCKTAHNIVLVALPIGWDDSLELLYKSIQALGDAAECQVLIKFHPKMGNPDVLVSLVLGKFLHETLPSHFEIVNRPIPDLLAEAGMLLFNSTAVAYEAVALGIPALFIQSDIWLDLNKLAWFPEVAESARTPEEIRAAVTRLLAEGAHARQRRRKRAQRALAKSFIPVTPETLHTFLEL